MADLKLTLTDERNGTASAQITGSDPTSTNRVFVYFAHSQEASEVGSCQGNGIVTFAWTAGLSYAYVISDPSGERSADERMMITNGYDSRHYLAMLGLQDRIIQLDLPGIGRNVLVRKLPETAQGLELPCILITPLDLEAYKLSHTCFYDVDHPCTVLICDRDDPDYQPPLERWLFWRQEILDEIMSDPRLTSVRGHHRMTPKGGDAVLIERLQGYAYVQSYINLTHEFKVNRR